MINLQGPRVTLGPRAGSHWCFLDNSRSPPWWQAAARGHGKHRTVAGDPCVEQSSRRRAAGQRVVDVAGKDAGGGRQWTRCRDARHEIGHPCGPGRPGIGVLMIGGGGPAARMEVGIAKKPRQRGDRHATKT